MPVEVEVDDLIKPLLKLMEIECDKLKQFIATGDFPYHKLYTEKIVEHTSEMLLLAGEITAIYVLRNHTILENEFTEPVPVLLNLLS